MINTDELGTRQRQHNDDMQKNIYNCEPSASKLNCHHKATRNKCVTLKLGNIAATVVASSFGHYIPSIIYVIQYTSVDLIKLYFYLEGKLGLHELGQVEYEREGEGGEGVGQNPALGRVAQLQVTVYHWPGYKIMSQVTVYHWPMYISSAPGHGIPEACIHYQEPGHGIPEACVY